jgi:hypothetical protein
MKKISILILTVSSFWGMAQERPEMDENADLEGPHTPMIKMSPIATDRPDITESAFITPVGWFQYEGGYQYSTSVSNLDITTNRHQIEEVLRFGLTERFEVRAVINANTEAFIPAYGFINPAGVRGIDPVTIGFKYNLLEESDKMPQTTWLSHVSFPQVAFGDYRAVTQGNTVFHEQRLMLEKGITSKFGLATNIGVSGALNGTSGYINEGMFSLAAGYDLGNDWGVYLEYFTNWELVQTQLFHTPFIDGGITKLLSNDLQLDVYAGYDLSETVGVRNPTTGFIAGAGISYRLPLAHHLSR